eukprot:m.407279 g.407279  ORF g.407279 m.407279 type:complete len:59 (+) comp21221_c0_seq2:2563-2739(+)
MICGLALQNCYDFCQIEKSKEESIISYLYIISVTLAGDVHFLDIVRYDTTNKLCITQI